MSQTVDIPAVLTIEHGAARRLRDSEVYTWIENRRVAVICGNGETHQVAEHMLQQIFTKTEKVKTFCCKNNAMATVNRLECELFEFSAEIVIGIGGGKVLDVTKVVGTRMNIPFILIPTAISNDAICSPVAVVTMNKKASIGVKMPKAVIIDLDVVSSAPTRLMRAGIGDLLSNRTALFDWDLAYRAKQDTMNTFARLMSHNAVEAFLHAVDNEKPGGQCLMKVLAESLVMSGIAMSVAGSSRPCSGSEHLISHALDYYCGAKALHGEQVALGILIVEYLQGRHHSTDSLRRYFDQLWLPTHYAELGYTKDEMRRAIRMAPAMRDRYTVLNEYAWTDRQIDQLLDDVFSHREARIISLA